MNPLTYVSNLTKNHAHKKAEDGRISIEMVAIGIFLGFYVLMRLIERYLVPMIPDFFRTEVSALFRWSPVLIPILFGILYMKPKKGSGTQGERILKRKVKTLPKISYKK